MVSFSVDEGGMRVPTIMRWPGKIPPGTVCREVAATIDFLPTFAGLAGAALPEKTIDGHDITGLLRGAAGAKSPHSAYLYFKGKNVQAVRSGKWKLHLPKKRGRKRTRPAGGAELFDLSSDIGESKNLASAHPELVAEADGEGDRARPRRDRPGAAAARGPAGE